MIFTSKKKVFFIEFIFDFSILTSIKSEYLLYIEFFPFVFFKNISVYYFIILLCELVDSYAIYLLNNFYSTKSEFSIRFFLNYFLLLKLPFFNIF
jgi:hypothetical protein